MAIGGVEGPDETTFGFIGHVTPDHLGGLYVFSGPPAALRQYDAIGTFVRQVGQEGSGPGEYLDNVMGIGVMSDGRVVLRDQENGRFNVYSPEGSYLDTWMAPTNLYVNPAMAVDTLDHVYLKMLVGNRGRGRPWPIGLLHLGPDGAILDTVPPPMIEGEPGGDFRGYFRPEKRWAFSPSRQIIVGVSDTYRFEIRNFEGEVLRIEMPWTPVALGAEEKRAWQEYQDRQQRTLPMDLDPIPSHKPAYRNIFAGLDDTIWIHLHTAAQRSDATLSGEEGRRPQNLWPEPAVFDVFEADGTYLGKVRVPPRIMVLAFSRTFLWGVRRGELDEQYAVRLLVRSERDGF